MGLGVSGWDGAVSHQHQAVPGLLAGPELRRDPEVSELGGGGQCVWHSARRSGHEALQGTEEQDRGQEQLLP